MNSWFANISVTMKLMLGFGLVLVFTALLALVGWSGLDSMINRSNWMGDIAKLNSQLTNMRVARLQYMLSEGDETFAQPLQAAVNELRKHQQRVLDTFKSPEDIRLLQQLAGIINHYEQSLAIMRKGFIDNAAQRTAMATHADKGAGLIAQINDDVEKMPTNDERRFALSKALTKAREDLMLVRYEMRGYMANITGDTEQTVNRQLEIAINGLQPLKAAFGDSQSERIQQLETALISYRTAVQNFKLANANIAQARQEMSDQGQLIVNICNKLSDLQVTRRDRESVQARTLQLTCTALALLLGIFAALIITRQITRPLRETLTVVDHIAAGDLSQTMLVTRRDELGVLQQGIQRMGVTLRELIGGIRDGVTQIASAAEELSAVTEQTSAGVNSQKTETDQVATAMHEMSTTVHEVARHAETAREAASEADTQARAGDLVVIEAITQIERLAAEVGRSSEAMSELEQESAKISKVMDVIKTVAEQTNLLALNAAIEAARAGEAGRGFAVVADEVRGLAQRTQQSTEEIESLVAGLQNGTRQVSSIMLSSRELTGSSVELARKAGASLENITQTVSNIQSMNQQIATAAEQQSSVAEEISRSILHVRDVAEQTASASEETAASSVELARLGNQLQQMVSHFKV